MNANFAKNLLRGLLLAAIVLFGTHAVAQEKSASELAQEHFNAGAKAYLADDYSEAVVQFLTAYEYQENPMILYNLSLAYQGLGDLEKALSTAQRAEDGGLPDKAVPRNAARMVALGTGITSTDFAERISSARQAEIQRIGETDGTASDADSVESESSLGAIGWVGVGGMAVGSGLLAYALVLELTLANEIEQFERTPSLRERERLADDQQTGKIILFTGGGLAVTGLALFLYDFLTESEPAVTAGIVADEAGAVLQIGGRF